jgi:CheY-like chemotaxis protein
MTNILVVDDDPDFREWAATALRNRGYAVVSTRSVEYMVASQLPLTFDAAIIDMIMPHLDGIETIRALRAQNPSIRILAVSGGGEHGDVEGYLNMALRFGATGCLAKPFTAIDLHQALERTLRPS